MSPCDSMEKDNQTRLRSLRPVCRPIVLPDKAHNAGTETRVVSRAMPAEGIRNVALLSDATRHKRMCVISQEGR